MTEKIGIIAGEGKMPLYIAQKAAQKGYEVVIAGLKGNAREEDFKTIPCTFRLLRLGQLGTGLEFFKSNGVKKILMAGRVQHTSIFANLMPDLRGAKFLASLKNMGTQYLLSRVIDEFKKEGIEFTNSALFLEDFMPGKGVLTKRPPTPQETQAASFGFKIESISSSFFISSVKYIADFRLLFSANFAISLSPLSLLLAYFSINHLLSIADIATSLSSLSFELA